MDGPHLDPATHSMLAAAATRVLVSPDEVPAVLVEVASHLGAGGATVFDVDPMARVRSRASTGRDARHDLPQPIELAAAAPLITLTIDRLTGDQESAQHWFGTIEGSGLAVTVYPVVESGAQVGGLVVAFPTRQDREAAPDGLLTTFAVACDRALRQSDRQRDDAHNRTSNRLLRSLRDCLVGDDLHADRPIDLGEFEAGLAAFGSHLGLHGLVVMTCDRRLEKIADWAVEEIQTPTTHALAAADTGWLDGAAESHLWHSGTPTPDGSLASLFGPGTSGQVATARHQSETLAGVIALADEVPLPHTTREMIERLARIVRTFVFRTQLEKGVTHRAQLDELRSRASELFLSSQQLDPDEVVREVLGKTAIAFDADEVLWAYRSNIADPMVACRYRRHDLLFDVFTSYRPDALVTPREPDVDLMHSQLDDLALERLGIDTTRYTAPEVTVAAIERSSEASSALVLIDYEQKHGRPDADHEAIVDLNRLFRQYHKGRDDRKAAIRDRRYEELRLAVADHLLRTPGDTVGDIADPAMTMIGRALGADYVGFRRAETNSFRDLVPWVTERGREVLDNLLSLDTSNVVQQDFFEVMSDGTRDVISMTDIPARSQTLLGRAGADEVHVCGAVVQHGEPGTALVAVRFGRTDWGTSERALLSSLGTQLQLSIDAMNDQQDRRRRSAMDDLVARVVSTLVDEPDFDRALSSVLSDVVESIGGVAAHWVIVGSRGISPFIRAAQRPQDESAAPLEHDSFDHWRITWESITEASFHDKDSPLVTALQQNFPDARVKPRMVMPVRDSEGVYSAWLDVAVTNEPAPDAINALVSIARLIHEIGERRNADRMLVTSFESAPTGQMLVDHAGVVHAANGAIRERFGDIRGTTWAEIDPDFIPGGPEREIALHMGNQSIWARVRSAIIDPNRKHRMAVVHVEDVTAPRLARANLQHEATHDQLTGLGNRRLLDQRLLEVSGRGGASLVMVDVDRFKLVNDSLGHSAGDQVLNTLADRLKHACQPSDVVCRFGGDEFAILMAGHREQHELELFAEQLLATLRAPIHVDGMALRMTCSLGITSAASPLDADTLLRQGDLALHDAKTSGRDGFCFFEVGSGDRFRKRLTMETAMRSGLDRGEFIPYFQPEYDLRTGEVLSLEALVRWNRGGQVVAAHDFIDIAEDVGLAPEMSRLVLEQSCKVASEWHRQGTDVHIRVNVTAAQLRSGYFDLEVLAALDHNGLEPSHLGLEVTERSLLIDLEATSATLDRLRAAGIEISVDDFGTGFSSLSWLRRLPVDTIKIDRSFVTNIAAKGADREIAKTVIGLARALDLDVVAEGVERSEQAEALIELGCTRAQGWLWSPAVGSGDVLELINSGTQSLAHRR